MAGGPTNPLTSFSTSIDFFNYTPVDVESSFGLELSWKVDTDAWAGIGVYRGTIMPGVNPNLLSGFDGFAVVGWNDLAPNSQYIDPWFLPRGMNGSLSLSLANGLLQAAFSSDGGAETLFNALDLSAFGWNPIAEDQVLSIVGAGAFVDFANFEASPDAPQATPIPGAIWLLGSGLVGLAGLRKRFQS